MLNSRFLLFILLTAFVFSCSKKEEELNSPINNPPVNNPSADSIVSFICDSTYSIQSVLYFTPSQVPMGCADIPTPSDSLVTLNIDIDGDSIADFECRANHNTTNWCSSHCLCWDYTIYISGLDSTKRISYMLQNGNPILPYDTTMSVSDNANWMQDAAILLNVPSVLNVTFTGCFIGVRKNNNFGWMQITPFGLNGISIKEFAYNHTANNSIRAGQR